MLLPVGDDVFFFMPALFPAGILMSASGVSILRVCVATSSRLRCGCPVLGRGCRSRNLGKINFVLIGVGVIEHSCAAKSAPHSVQSFSGLLVGLNSRTEVIEFP